MFQYIIMLECVLKISQKYFIFKKIMSLILRVFEIMKTLVIFFYKFWGFHTKTLH
jgi:hypothetical protein